jgi:nitroimidazol reductase NimA-like FMN-containing flavoprotein (pyridoxamine 5'-phosphate oxidase superfamily)
MLGDLNPDQIETMLSNEVIGRIGCSANGVTYIVPITYAYDSGYVYGHSKEGMKIQMMRLNSMVCFEIDWMDDLNNWQSVVAWGRFEELKGNEQKVGLNMIQSRLKSIQASEAAMPLNLQDIAYQSTSGQYKVVIYRIKLLEKTGKFEKTDLKPLENSSSPRKLTLRSPHQ